MPVIRAGEATDFEAIAAIQSASPDAAQWDVSGYLLYDLRVAEVEGRVSGFLVSRSLGGGECEVLNIAVAPEYRRKGIAQALVRALIGSNGCTIFLEVRQSNLAARKLYKSMGFKEISSRPDYYDSPSETAIVLKFHSC